VVFLRIASPLPRAALTKESQLAIRRRSHEGDGVRVRSPSPQNVNKGRTSEIGVFFPQLRPIASLNLLCAWYRHGNPSSEI
jgi:hypothetical protein